MDLNQSSKQYQLSSGTPCLNHKCVKCCIMTGMPLSRQDIKGILKQGYPLNNFSVRLKNGRQLKNHGGKCVFLSENRCRIYSDRPEGCKLYPLVFNENFNKSMLDDLCPYRHEFMISQDVINKVNNLLRRLEKEKTLNSRIS